MNLPFSPAKTSLLALFVLVFVSTVRTQINVQAVAARGQAVDPLFFQSQEIRLLVWNAIWAAHKGQIQFTMCLGDREMASTADDPTVSKTTLAVGWPAKQKIGVHKKVSEMIAKDGAGEIPPGGGPPAGGAGDDPKYVVDAFLGAFFHELKHVLVQSGDWSIPATKKIFECQAFACEIWYYTNVKNEDPCYLPAAQGGTLRRAQLCNRILATKKLANHDYNCGF